MKKKRIAPPSNPTDAAALLYVLRAAGCDVFVDVDDNRLYISPPAWELPLWPGDIEAAIDHHRASMQALIEAENLGRVH